MSSTAKTLLDSTFLATGAVALLYTSPVNGKGTYLDVLTVLNDNAAPQTVTLHIVPSGGATGAANQQVKAKPIATGAVDLLAEMRGKFLDPGDTVWGAASLGTSVSIFMSGRELA